MKEIIITLLISMSIFAQKNEKPNSTQVRTEIWLKQFKEIQSDSEKITMIKEKIHSDTLFSNNKNRIILDNPRNPEKHICKILFIINFENNYYDIDLLETPKLSKIMNNINLKNITSIEIPTNHENVNYFGELGRCGVIKMTCNKKLYRKLKRVF